MRKFFVVALATVLMSSLAAYAETGAPVAQMPAGTAARGAVVDVDCPIKGNVNAKGEKIYHPAGSPHYARTKIDTRSGDRCFGSETDAIAAGFRATRTRAAVKQS